MPQMIVTSQLLADGQRRTAAAEEQACLLCGSTTDVSVTGLSDNRLGTPGTYDILRCIHCRFEQTFPLPSLPELKELYETHYNFGGERDTLYTRLREWFFSSFLFRLWTRIDGDAAFYQRRGAGRLLDIGCNEGRGLPIYSRNGFRAEGQDLSETAAAVARSKGFDVHTGGLEDFDPMMPFDVAVLSNVLEHSLDPRKMLLNVHRILVSGGQVWISLPNSRSWLRNILGRSWINWHVPFHISHFSRATLRQLLEETGYGRIEIRHITPAVWAAHSVITFAFARKGRRTGQLRNPFLSLGLMALFRLVLFPVLWLGNRAGRGDCLVATATKG
jgi:SAM-dependent methyltransferase